MKFEQIEEDIAKFKEITKEEGLDGNSYLACILFELCLGSKGIEAHCVVGYLVTNDTHWILHTWNEFELNESKKQVDLSNHPLIDFKFTGKYLLYLRGNQIPLMKDNDKRRKDHDLICDINNKYITRGPVYAIEWTKQNTPDSELEAWKRVINRAKELETFETIENYLKFD